MVCLLVDIMLGIPPTEDISVLIAAMKQPEDTGEEWTLQREEWVAQLVEQCHQLLVHEDELYVGGWALIEPLIGPDGEGSDFEQEVVLLLTEKAFYIASYDEEEECVNQYECQPLENLEKIEIGQDLSQRFPNSGLRLHYRSKEESGYFHTFKALQNRTADEDKDVLHGIADEFRKASLVINTKPKVIECRLNKKKSKPHDVIQLSYKPRPCSGNNHYRCKKTSCSPKIVHSTSAPAKLDKMASPPEKTTGTENSEEVSQDEGNIIDSSCNTNKSGLYKRYLSAGAETLKQSDVSGVKITEHNFEGEFLSERSETNDNTKRLDCVSMTVKTSEQQVNLSEEANDGHSNENNVDINFANNADSPGTLLEKDNGQENSSKEGKLNQVSEDTNQHDKEACRKKVITEKQGAVSSDVNASPNQGRRGKVDHSIEVETSKELDQSETNSEKSIMNRLIKGGKKISSANSSPKMTRKQGDSNKTSNELPKESETSSSLTANLKKNFKNRFADISISFRKNDNSVNASEIRWQSEDSEDTPELPRTDGKRNILAAAQERGRAFIPELKNKFTGLSNRSPRLERRRDWEKVIQESGCRTTIIQI
ncbi:Phosphatidylinositide phosphatase SAC2 [Paramuricea clavata]|uniref:Phosphatidylinositide phosphatase SAC2 n=1 Tax=Paramuricea clavata TaxID=317549 RepID=A0A6S7HLJ7_PARCT|nr:Phosphatidylinositide phosphatase SAC2 [Paramuricea clavata]